MNIYVVIVSFNGGETLTRLIDDLGKETEGLEGLEVKIVVVDNGSVGKLRTKYQEPRTEIIENKKNLGFAKGANIGIKYALRKGADRVLLLNQDVIIEHGFFHSLIKNKSDIADPVIKFKRGDDWIYDYGGKVDWSIGRTYHIDSRPEADQPRAETNYQYSSSDPLANGESRSLPRTNVRGSRQARTTKNIDYVSGCCMLVKKEVFDKIGLFDERFFLYFEDVDFCLRAKREDFKIAVEPKSEIIHLLEEGKEKSIFKKYHLLRSNFLFINKYLGLRRILGYLYLLLLAIKMIL